jgi:hypothetical protein
LSPSAYVQWQALLGPLAAAIKGNVGLILAADMVDALAPATLPPDRVMATCLCVPSRIIVVKRAVLLGADVICDACGQPFRLVECDR